MRKTPKKDNRKMGAADPCAESSLRQKGRFAAHALQSGCVRGRLEGLEATHSVGRGKALKGGCLEAKSFACERASHDSCRSGGKWSLQVARVRRFR